MEKRESALCGGGSSKSSGTMSLSLPHAIGAASLVAAGVCVWWLRASDALPKFSPLRTLCLLGVCAYLVSATLLLLEDR